MVTCEACSKDVPQGNAFCTSCGAVITQPPGTGSPERPGGETRGICYVEQEDPADHKSLSRTTVHLHSFDIAIAMGGFLSIITGGEWALLTLLLIIGAGLSVLMLIIMLALQVVTGGGLERNFSIVMRALPTKQGAPPGPSIGFPLGFGSDRFHVRNGCRALCDVAGEQCAELGGGVVSIRIPQYALHGLSLKIPDKSRVLYCREENFPAILAMVKKYALPVATGNL